MPRAEEWLFSFDLLRIRPRFVCPGRGFFDHIVQEWGRERDLVWVCAEKKRNDFRHEILGIGELEIKISSKSHVISSSSIVQRTRRRKQTRDHQTISGKTQLGEKSDFRRFSANFLHSEKRVNSQGSSTEIYVLYYDKSVSCGRMLFSRWKVHGPGRGKGQG